MTEKRSPIILDLIRSESIAGPLAEAVTELLARAHAFSEFERSQKKLGETIEALKSQVTQQEFEIRRLNEELDKIKESSGREVTEKHAPQSELKVAKPPSKKPMTSPDESCESKVYFASDFTSTLLDEVKRQFADVREIEIAIRRVTRGEITWLVASRDGIRWNGRGQQRFLASCDIHGIDNVDAKGKPALVAYTNSDNTEGWVWNSRELGCSHLRSKERQEIMSHIFDLFEDLYGPLVHED